MSDEPRLLPVELRLAEGWCPHPDHGHMTPAGNWGRCDACGVLWRRDDAMPWLHCRAERMVDGNELAFTQVLDLYWLSAEHPDGIRPAVDEHVSHVLRTIGAAEVLATP